MIDDIKKVLIDITGSNENVINELIKSDSLNFLDSLQFINLIVGIEEKFEISFEPDEIEEMERVTDLINILNRKLS